MSINFETICRLCMAESKSMISVFEKSHSLTEKIMTLVPVVKISEGDNLPAQVCEGCVNQVNTWHSFKLQCENSHFTLSQLLKAQQQEDPQASDVPGLRRPPDVPPIETIILETKCKQEVEDEEREVFPELEEEIPSFEPEIKLTVLMEEDPIVTGGLPEGGNVVKSKEKTVPCHVCGRLLSRRKLNEHVRRHLGGRPFNCDVCGKNFAEKDSLKKHSLVHSGLKAHMCDVCGKRFKLSNHLKAHHLTHTGQKSYVCEVCGKRFSQLGNFKKHEFLHTGERPFRCDICGKSYSRKDTLQDHLAFHSGRRQHVCKICGKGFLVKAHLRTHLVVHSGEKKFSCDLCGTSYTRRNNLKKHACKHATSHITRNQGHSI